MAEVERVREVVTGPVSPEELQRRMADGWRLVAVEWERERVPAQPAQPSDPVPFGLRVSGDCAHLEENPEELEILLAMMELTIQDGPYSAIAAELNRRGFRTREGAHWTPISVFQMLPRLIEVGPKIFSTAEWQKRRQHLLKLQSR